MAKSKSNHITAETARRIAQTLSNKRPLCKRVMLKRIPNKDYLTTLEVAKVCDVHSVTVYKWVRLGHMKAYRVRNRGKANLYRRADVVALVESRFRPRPVGAIRETRKLHGSHSKETTPKASAVRRGKASAASKVKRLKRHKR